MIYKGEIIYEKSDIEYKKTYRPNCKIFRELYPQAEILGDKLLLYKVRKLEPVILGAEQGFTFVA